MIPALGLAQGFYYNVQKGDTIERVADRFSASPVEIASANRLRVDSELVAGSHLYIPRSPRPQPPAYGPSQTRSTLPARAVSPGAGGSRPLSGREVIVQPGDSLWKIARDNSTTVAELARVNGIDPDRVLVVGQRLKLPGSGASTRQVPATPVQTPLRVDSSRPTPRGVSASSRGYIWPAHGKVLRHFTRTATEKHFGLDIALPVGSDVLAARDGTVVYTGSSIRAYGNMVMIDHGDGFATCYAFNSKILVRDNQRVRRGQVIALSGDSAKHNDPSIHFQLRKNAIAIDPEPYLP